ncbi:MAG: DUF2628 domain-containing protein [Proteobacteria bacterium]|nr:DUF2628 domain-containing protein [Pseudomonadota bacterium]
MTRQFENPANGYREEVGFGASVGTFFFGFIYLAIKGQWRHAAAILIAIVILIGALGPPGVMFIFVIWVGYAIAAPSIIANSYLRNGWREVEETYSSNVAPPVKKNDTKKCPKCAEEVKFEAKICRFCRHEFTESVEAPARVEVPDTALLQQYGIASQEGEFVYVGMNNLTRRFDNADDAIDFVKREKAALSNKS